MDAVAQVVSDVVLRDGSTMRFRAPVKGDARALLGFFGGLSDQSLYRRFHGHPSVDNRLVAPMLDPDWVERGALVGTVEEKIVAVAGYVRLRAASSAEVAFAVADEYQGRGIATRLLERLASLAASVEIDEFVAEVMPSNTGMLGVFAEAGFQENRVLEAGTVEVRLQLEATESLRKRIDERDHVAVAASLTPFFEPSSIAVVGASPRAGSIGGELFRNVLRAEFRGVAFPVNRSGESVAGVRSYRSIAGIGSPSISPSSACQVASCSRPHETRSRPGFAPSASSRQVSPRPGWQANSVNASCSSLCALTAHDCSGPIAWASRSRMCN